MLLFHLEVKVEVYVSLPAHMLLLLMLCNVFMEVPDNQKTF